MDCQAFARSIFYVDRWQPDELIQWFFHFNSDSNLRITKRASNELRTKQLKIIYESHDFPNHNCKFKMIAAA